jgi:hypothetical protein
VYSAPYPIHGEQENENNDRVKQEDSRIAFDVGTEYAYTCLQNKPYTAFFLPAFDPDSPDGRAILNEKVFHGVGLRPFDC